MSVPADQMMMGGPPGPPPPDPMMMGGGPPTGPVGIPPNLLPFASTQPGGIEQLAGPLLAQQALDQEALRKQQLEAIMAVVMQHMAQMPNPAAQDAQVEPSPPLDGTLGGPDAAPDTQGAPLGMESGPPMQGGAAPAGY